MWESRPLPKIIRKPPSPLSAQGGLLLSALCCRACKTPQLREFPNQPSASFLPSFLPSFGTCISPRLMRGGQPHDDQILRLDVHCRRAGNPACRSGQYLWRIQADARLALRLCSFLPFDSYRHARCRFSAFAHFAAGRGRLPDGQYCY